MMPTYVVLGNFTDQGAKDPKGRLERIASYSETLQATGITMIGAYLTMGEYDVVSIYEAPSDEAMAEMVLTAASRGNIRTKTMRAFTLDEATDMVSRLP